ncbi:hypothetical protein BJ322DRAFT_1104380 [Thelephora terrestris]|uniref:DUF6533 domain-containing protein n=1 Tax=Thelephora terrestris TaxID=56493 RepID=A0A9P6LB29_9AGAM|nr:hypothetical protein BJ322DRAFT_1104380 [Thelephora terrestris]
MSSALDLLIQAGHDITSIKVSRPRPEPPPHHRTDDDLFYKYYALATGTILFYDHLLTLADEVKYAWSGKKSWTFWLFLINRYFPMTFQFLLLAVSYGPNPHPKISWYSIFMFVFCTLLAQIVLTVRAYAVTKKNTPIAIGFAIITLSQLVLGIVVVVFAAKGGVQPLPPIPLDAYRLCLFVRHRTLEVVYTGISLLYDLLAFLLTIILARRSKTSGLQIPTILKIIAEDATRYFLVIFTSHFTIGMIFNTCLPQESIQLLPASGNVVFLPVMISRIMLSLKKAADSQRNGWSLGEPSTNGVGLSAIKFSSPRRGLFREGSDEIPLDTFPESGTAASWQLSHT